MLRGFRRPSGSPLARVASCAPGALVLGLVLSAPPRAEAGAITGVCPDGSMYVVQDASAIPCKDSKRVAPHQLPPMRPDYLPRPYTWMVYEEAQNPNNPYNALDSARQVRALREGAALPGGPAGGGAPPGGGAVAAPPAVSSAPAPVGALHPQAPAAGPRDLGLTDGELRDLFFIVELAQERAPAVFVKEKANGSQTMRLSLGYSRAFEQRLQESWARSGAPVSNRVLLFTLVALQADTFQPNFTLTQGHLAAQIDAADPRQMALLQGRFGALQRDEVALGYLVLPEGMDLARPVDVYWDDRRLAATFE